VPVLRIPLVRALATAEAWSSLGTAMTVVAVAYLSYADSKSVVHTVLVSAAYSLPTAVFGILAGRVAAQVSHRNLLWVCNALKLAVFLGMAALAAADLLDVPVLVVTSIVSGTISAFSTPAWMELQRDVVPSDRLDETNALITAAASGAALVGAFLGGVLLGTVGAWSLFLLDALSYLGFLWCSGGRTRARPRRTLRTGPASAMPCATSPGTKPSAARSSARPPSASSSRPWRSCSRRSRTASTTTDRHRSASSPAPSPWARWRWRTSSAG
jgi:MFS family permease